MKKLMVILVVLIVAGSVLFAFRGFSAQFKGREGTVVDNQRVETQAQLRQEKLEKNEMIQQKKMLQLKDDPEHECEDCEDCGEPEQKMTQMLKQEKKFLNASEQNRGQLNDQAFSAQGGRNRMIETAPAKEIQPASGYRGRNARNALSDTTDQMRRMNNNLSHDCDCGCED